MKKKRSIMTRFKQFLFGRPETKEESKKRIHAHRMILAAGAKPKTDKDGKIRIEKLHHDKEDRDTADAAGQGTANQHHDAENGADHQNEAASDETQ